MSIKERAKAHFKAQLDAEARSVEVPEWGEPGKPALIYFKPLTLAQKNTIYGSMTSGNLESLAVTLIVRALNEDGSKVFAQADRVELMRSYDPDVIARVVNAMNAADQEAKASLAGES
jgi:hypothetical protein